jgi:hypothetical protein
VGFNRRHIEPSRLNQTNRLSEIGLEAQAGVLSQLGNHHFTFNIGSQGQNQSYPLRQVQVRQYLMNGNAEFAFPRDSLKFQALISRYKYDIAPEVYSANTHDEIIHSYKTVHLHNYGEGLTLETQIRSDLRHLVYLKAERSADNHWERFFLLSPEVRYLSPGWGQRARFGVSADYIDYDFEEYSPPSQVFRKFSADDSLYCKFSSHWGLKIHYLFILEDQGQLNWSAFTQELSDKYRTNDGTVMFEYRHNEVEYGIGWGIYHRYAEHYGDTGSISPKETVTSSGPVISLSGTGARGWHIGLTASFRRIVESSKNSYTQTMMDLALFKAF